MALKMSMKKALKTTSLIGYTAVVVLMLVFSVGCKKEKFITDSSAKLEFSNDTIIFDTVFTTVGSTTQYLKIYNRNKGILKVSSIFLEGGESSYYRLNVDGVPGKAFSDIEVGPEDSLFIFVEVTIDPNSATTPLIVSDKIIFETNGNEQHVDLVAWGQDAYFFRPSSGSNAFIMPCNVTLNTDKPNVFYGYAIVDEGCCLTVPAGAKLHFHPGSGIIVYKGCLNVTGTAASPVVIQGDRLEYDYREISGQWDGIRFIQPQNSFIEHALIKNAFYGIWVDTTFSTTNFVTVSKTEIRNMASLGIYGNAGAQIKATNTLVKNCGMYGVALTYGGDFTFNHCTFANYWSDEARSSANFYIKNWFEMPSGAANVRDLNLMVDNTIIDGGIDNEFETDLQSGAVLNYVFSNCFIKTEQDLTDVTHFVSVSKNVNPLFENVSEGIFSITVGSPCRGAANFTGGITDDILDNPRDASPDVGCYEYQ